jgi:hypothetical protein
MQRRKIPSLITTRCAGWHRAGGIHPRRRANRRPDNRDLDHPCRPRRRHQMEGPGTASNAAPAIAILPALRQDGSRPRSQKQDLSGSRKSGSQWTRRWREVDSNLRSRAKRTTARHCFLVPFVTTPVLPKGLTLPRPRDHSGRYAKRRSAVSVAVPEPFLFGTIVKRRWLTWWRLKRCSSRW